MEYDTLASDQQIQLPRVLLCLCAHVYIDIVREKPLNCSNFTTKVIGWLREAHPQEKTIRSDISVDLNVIEDFMDIKEKKFLEFPPQFNKGILTRYKLCMHFWQSVQRFWQPFFVYKLL